jgi:hypothetical protein
MFSPNPKRPKLNQPAGNDPQPLSPRVKKRLWSTVSLTFALLFIYYGCIALGFVKPIMIIYFVAFAAILVIYLAYNRGFVNKDVTVDMLPADWSTEKKQAFVDANRVRAEKSRWMVMLIVPFVIVFMCEALYLFVWEGYLAKLFLG